MVGRGSNPWWSGGDRAQQGREAAARRRELASRLKASAARATGQGQLPLEGGRLAADGPGSPQGELYLAPRERAAHDAEAQAARAEAFAGTGADVAVLERPPAGDTSRPGGSALSDDRPRADSAAQPALPRPKPWLVALGLRDRVALCRMDAELRVSAASEPGSATVLLAWPSPPPSAMLSWAVGHLGRGRTEASPLRVLFVGGGRADSRLLAEAAVSRGTARPLWRPDLSVPMNPMRDAMASAFLPNRLLPGAPDTFFVSQLVPVLQALPDEASPWPDEWDGFLRGAREFVRGARDRADYLWRRYGDAASTRPFAFALPAVSAGKRREREIQLLPGGADLVVADLSARWMWPARVGEEVENLVLDVAAALDRTPLPRFLFLVSDPRCQLAAARKLRELRENDILPGRGTLRRLPYVGDREGRPSPALGGWPGRIRVHAASTTEADIQQGLAEAAGSLAASHPRTADALVEAARELARMACSIAPPLAGGREPDVGWTFVDAARVVRDAMREEGEPGEIRAIERLLDRGRDAATRLLRISPARVALEDASEAARRGRRVAFVAESPAEAGAAAAEAPPGLLLTARGVGCSRALAAHGPELLVAACRGPEALRLLAELPAAPAETVLLLPPSEAAQLAHVAGLVLEQPAFSGAHELCREVVRRMPPSFGRLAEGADVYQRRRPSRGSGGAGGGWRGGPGGPRDGVRLSTEDGDTVVFARGSSVVALVDGQPVARRASALQPGDVVVVLPEDLGDRIARELGWDGESALLDEQVTRYKAAVRDWREGAGAGLTSRQVVQRMVAVDPGMDPPSDSAVRYWLAGGEAAAVAAPHASGNPRWLAAFLTVVGLGGADALFAHFGAFRGRLLRDGHMKSGLLERFLFDRYDAVIQRGVSRERAEELRSTALQHAREILAVERPDSGEEE